jgi:hypothetical protein
MATKYFAATASDGLTVVRPSATRTYTAASILKRQGEKHWRSSWSGTRALAEKVSHYQMAGDLIEVVDAREVDKAEYLKLKAAFDASVVW